MAFNKKNKRRITIGEKTFYWTIKNQLSKDILRLTVMTEDENCSRLVCKFNYKDFWFYFKEIIEGKINPHELYEDELLKAAGGSITPRLVRQVIDYALTKGWKPSTKNADFVITETEAKIDESFRTKLTNPKSKIRNRYA